MSAADAGLHVRVRQVDVVVDHPQAGVAEDALQGQPIAADLHLRHGSILPEQMHVVLHQLPTRVPEHPLRQALRAAAAQIRRAGRVPDEARMHPRDPRRRPRRLTK